MYFSDTSRVRILSPPPVKDRRCSARRRGARTEGRMALATF